MTTREAPQALVPNDNAPKDSALSPAQAIRKAAALIETRGLAKRAYEDSNGRLCTIGAIRVAFGAPNGYGLVSDSQFLTYHATLMAIQASIGDNVANWNDNPRRPAAYITTTLYGLADKLDKEQEGKSP